MATMKEKQDATPRRDEWHAIEGRVFGQCIWQEVSFNRRMVLEGLVHKRSSQILIVQKSYDRAIPRNGRGTFPELESVTVFAPVEPQICDWQEYEQALQRIGPPA